MKQLPGFWGKATPFIRTPQQGSRASGGWADDDNRAAPTPSARPRGPWPLAEGLLTLYFLVGLAAGFYYHDLGLLPFHLLLVAGQGTPRSPATGCASSGRRWPSQCPRPYW